nr:hypothetical protein [Tanacetum cinerariifolium]
ARSLPPSSPSDTTLPIHQILPAPPSLPRRPAVLVLLRQPIPIGRPYRTQPNGVRKMLKARKRVRALPAGLLVSRYLHDHSSLDHFLLDDSSLDSLLDSSSGYSLDISSRHSIPDSSFDTLIAISARPSRKRCRSSTSSALISLPVYGALSPIHANLLPPRKRIRGFISATNFEVSSEESYKPYTEPDIDSDVQVDIDAGIAAADAATARETDVRVKVGIETEAEANEEANAEIQPEGTIEIIFDVAIEIDIQDDLLMPDTIEIYDIESRQREQEGKNLIADDERSSLLERIMALEGSKLGLRDALGIEKVRADSFQRRLGYVEEELRQFASFVLMRVKDFGGWRPS